MRAGFAGCVLAAAAGPALPQASKTYCSEPVTPFCTNRGTVFEDDRSRESCRDEVEAYREGMRAFVACLGTQQDEARKYSQEIEARFRCMAEGRKDCP